MWTRLHSVKLNSKNIALHFKLWSGKYAVLNSSLSRVINAYESLKVFVNRINIDTTFL